MVETSLGARAEIAGVSIRSVSMVGPERYKEGIWVLICSGGSATLLSASTRRRIGAGGREYRDTCALRTVVLSAVTASSSNFESSFAETRDNFLLLSEEFRSLQSDTFAARLMPPTRALMSSSGRGSSVESGAKTGFAFFLTSFLDLTGRDLCFSKPWIIGYRSFGPASAAYVSEKNISLPPYFLRSIEEGENCTHVSS